MGPMKSLLKFEGYKLQKKKLKGDGENRCLADFRVMGLATYFS